MSRKTKAGSRSKVTEARITRPRQAQHAQPKPQLPEEVPLNTSSGPAFVGDCTNALYFAAINISRLRRALEASRADAAVAFGALLDPQAGVWRRIAASHEAQGGPVPTLEEARVQVLHDVGHDLNDAATALGEAALKLGVEL